MKTFWIILGVVIVIFSGIWFFVLRNRKPATDESTVNTAIPAAYDPSVKQAEMVPFKFKFGSNLELSYPKNWSLSEGEDNNKDSQIVTIESPKDDNGHYFCINFDEYGPNNNADLSVKNVKLLSLNNFSAGGIGKGLQLVTYSPMGQSRPRLALTDELNGSTSNTSFKAEITNPVGRRVQAIGRFDCREENQPELTLEQFNQAHWTHIAQQIYLSLKF